MFNMINDSAFFDGEDEIDRYIKSQKATATVNKERTNENRFKAFCATIDETRLIDKIPPPELDNILCRFFMTAKSVKGELYEPDTLTGFLHSFQRILESRDSKLNLKSDEAIFRSRNVLKSRRKELVKLGKGNKPNATRALTPSEVIILYKKEFFGDSCALTLQRTGHRFSND